VLVDGDCSEAKMAGVLVVVKAAIWSRKGREGGETGDR